MLPPSSTNNRLSGASRRGDVVSRVGRGIPRSGPAPVSSVDETVVRQVAPSPPRCPVHLVDERRGDVNEGVGGSGRVMVAAVRSPPVSSITRSTFVSPASSSPASSSPVAIAPGMASTPISGANVQFRELLLRRVIRWLYCSYVVRSGDAPLITQSSILIHGGHHGRDYCN